MGKTNGKVVAEEDWAAFPLAGCWSSVFSEIEASLSVLLRERDLTPPEIAATAKLKYAISRLPEVTVGVCIEASVEVSHERGRGWLGFQLDDDCLWIYCREVFNEPRGSETECRDVLRVFGNGESSAEGCDPISVMIDLEEWVNEWVSRIKDSACLFSIEDDGDQMDWEQPRREDPWALLVDEED